MSDASATAPGTEERARLRVATPDDLDAVNAIEQRVFGSDAWSREMLREELSGPHRHYLVLEARRAGSPEESPTGTAEGGGADPDSAAILGYAGLLALGPDGDVQTIALSPEARGRGWGRQLMDELLAEALRRNVRHVFLEVRADNPVAIRLYERLGFAEIGVRPRYYQPDGVDAIVMKKDM